jgi:outer membrane lipoprotein carrier protein
LNRRPTFLPSIRQRRLLTGDIDPGHANPPDIDAGPASLPWVTLFAGAMRFFVAFSLCFALSTAHAAGLQQLKGFLTGVQTLAANFEQIVTDRNGKQVQRSTGIMQFSRPGRFRWEYVKPYEQIIVGDGEKLWLYDPDLNQVTVRKLADTIGSSPAALLAGDNQLERDFTLKDGGQADKLAWVEATPKSKETTFERVRLGFNDSSLEVMELFDNFGQKTVIRFSSLEINLKIPESVFKFVPPKGADVITQ